jgi:ParB-like nuclease domain
MNVSKANVVRHFLRLEAIRPQYSARKTEILQWCELPDSELLTQARGFGEERRKLLGEINPVFVYTVGVANDNRYTCVSSWSRSRILCKNIYVFSISPAMSSDLDAVRGNVLQFALNSAAKYREFRPLSTLSDDLGTLIVVAQQRPNRDGVYELIDGAHRLVALCRAAVEDVEAYVAHC